MKLPALPLRVQDGAFQKAESPEALLCFARCFFSESVGAVPDDAGFGGRGVPWGKSGALLMPIEPVVAEFRRRYGSVFDIRAFLAEVETPGGENRRVRVVSVALRSAPGVTANFEV
jgi:hypothetical protein